MPKLGLWARPCKSDWSPWCTAINALYQLCFCLVMELNWSDDHREDCWALPSSGDLPMEIFRFSESMPVLNTSVKSPMHMLCRAVAIVTHLRSAPLTGWRSSLIDMGEAPGPPGGGSEGSPGIYMDAAKAASRQLQTLGPLIAAIGQAQLLQQRTASELRSISR